MPLMDHVKLTAPRTIHGRLRDTAHLCNVWGVAREVKVQNNARKTDFLEKLAIIQDYHVARTLTGWFDTGYLRLMSS